MNLNLNYHRYCLFHRFYLLHFKLYSAALVRSRRFVFILLCLCFLIHRSTLGFLVCLVLMFPIFCSSGLFILFLIHCCHHCHNRLQHSINSLSPAWISVVACYGRYPTSATTTSYQQAVKHLLRSSFFTPPSLYSLLKLNLPAKSPACSFLLSLFGQLSQSVCCHSSTTT